MLNAAFAVAVIAAVTIAAPEAHARHVTVQEVAPGIAKVWAPDQWERGLPPREVRETYRRALYHAANRRHRRAMRYFWRSRARVFLEHRAEQLAAQREAERMAELTPYDCGSAGSFAIPCGVVACESDYLWSAYNPSGAAGPYQIMPMWGRPWPVVTEADKREHHRIASEIWNGGAGASNWVCA